MRKIVFASFLAGMVITSCNSDDDSGNGNNNPMVGDWKATEITYTIPGMGDHTVAFSSITQGCDVDELELKANNTVELETEAKVDGLCVEFTITGTWNEDTVTVNGETEPRQVESVNNSELVLKYEMTYPQYGTTMVSVKYVKS